MYKLLKIGSQANVQVREYISDTVSDIANLPDGDPFGSTVYVIDTGETYIKNSSGEYKIKKGGSGEEGGSNMSFDVNATIDYNTQTGKQVITISKTVKEIYDALSDGEKIIMHLVMQIEGSSVPITKIIPFDVQKMEIGDEITYNIGSFTINDNGITAFFAEALSADDAVILNEV